MSDKPQIGDRVSIIYPDRWERFGKVIETDYHPMGYEDAVKIRFEDEGANKAAEWWDSRYVTKVEVPND